jgi:positive phototaxis protein PixI
MVSAIQLISSPSTHPADSFSNNLLGAPKQFESIAGESGERFLGFAIQPDQLALISLGKLQGAIELPLPDILPMPQMSPHLLGIVNWRGKSTWVADLAQLMGEEYYTQRCPQATKATLLMVQAGDTAIGLVVDRTISVAVYDSTLALPIDENLFPRKMSGFLDGYFLDSQDRTWALINLTKIFQTMNL